MLKRIIPLLIFFTVKAASAEPMAISVDEAVEKALLHSPDFKESRFNKDAASADHSAAKTKFFPTVSAQGNFTHTGKLRTVSFNGATFSSGAADATELTGKVEQTLFAGGAVVNGARQTERVADAKTLSEKAVRNAVAAKTRSICYDIFRAKALHGAASESLRSALEHQKVAEARVREGAAPAVEKARAEVLVKQAALTEIARRNDVKKTEARLAILIGAPTATEFSLTGSLPSSLETSDNDEPEKRALTRRPDLLAVKAGADAEALGIRVAQASYFPAFSAFGNWTLYDDNTRRADDTWNVGVSGSWEIFNWFRTKRSVEAAEARAAAAGARARISEDQVKIEVQDAVLAQRAAGESIRHAQARVAASEEELRISRLRFQEGVGTGTEVVDAEAAHSDALASLINAQADAALARNQLWLVTGGD